MYARMHLSTHTYEHASANFLKCFLRIWRANIEIHSRRVHTATFLKCSNNSEMLLKSRSKVLRRVRRLICLLFQSPSATASSIALSTIRYVPIISLNWNFKRLANSETRLKPNFRVYLVFPTGNWTRTYVRMFIPWSLVENRDVDTIRPFEVNKLFWLGFVLLDFHVVFLFSHV